MNTKRTQIIKLEESQTMKKNKWSFLLSLAFSILMLLGTAACLVFGDRGSVSPGTMGMLLGTVSCMFGTSLSYVDYRMEKRDVA